MPGLVGSTPGFRLIVYDDQGDIPTTFVARILN